MGQTWGRVIPLSISLLLGGCSGMGVAQKGTVLHVAPDGNDVWSGRLERAAKGDGPLATLDGARRAVRALRTSGTLPPGPVTVLFAPGVYRQTAPLFFTEQDAGTAASPVRYVARPGTEVIFSGGIVISPDWEVRDDAAAARLDAAARPHVRIYDIGNGRLPEIAEPGQKGWFAPLWISENGIPLTAARWPNTGFVKIADATRSTKGSAPSPEANGFTYAGDRPDRWVGEADPRVSGFLGNDWAAANVRVASIDPALKRITQGKPSSAYGFRKGGRWFGYNLLCELDAPGEVYADLKAERLFVWPKTDTKNAEREVARCRALLILRETAHLTFEGITFTSALESGVEVRRSEDLGFTRCQFRSIAGTGLLMESVRRVRVAGCEFTHLGAGGLSASSGDAQQLTPGGLVVDNNHFAFFGLTSLSYAPALQLSGCGARVTHNLFHEGPHAAILFGGREHRIAYNEIHSVCLVAGEMGAIYTGRDWTLVGNVIENNHIHDIYRACPQPTRGIMLDDGVGGLTVRNNLFVRCAEGLCLAAIGNVVSNNMFVACFPAIGTWRNWTAPEEFDLSIRNNGTRLARLAKVPVDASPWKERYPELAMLRDAIRDRKPRPAATYSRIVANVAWKGAGEWIHNHYKTFDGWVIENNLVTEDPLFVSPERDDYRLRTQSPAHKKGIRPLPTERMGLYASSERAVWPVSHPVNTGCGNLTYVPSSDKN